MDIGIPIAGVLGGVLSVLGLVSHCIQARADPAILKGEGGEVSMYVK